MDTISEKCEVCGEIKTAPNKGLGRASIAVWRTQHQHLDSPADAEREK